ncbi:MAG: hypothetical protein ACPGWS_10255 [Solirubrobacterales bacterium]
MELSVKEQRKRALALTGISIAIFLIGWLMGMEGGADLDAARAEGTKAGTAVGLRQGKKSGYAAGFKKGESTAYKASYSKAYRTANPDSD